MAPALVVLSFVLSFLLAANDTTPRAPACANELSPNDTLHYVSLTGPMRPAGSLRIWRGPNGTTRFVEEARQVGRAYTPSTTIRSDGEFCVGADGVVQRMSMRIRSGTRTVRSQTFTRTREAGFPRISGEPRPHALQALLFQSALRAPNHTLRFIGGGTATIRALTTLAVANKRVTLYELREEPGIAYHLWLDENTELFADTQTDFDVLVPTAWTGVTAQLALARAHAADSAIRATAERLTPPADVTIAIVNATVIAVESGVAYRGATVYINGKHIVGVATDPVAEIPAETRIIDAHGGAVIPGLWDTHAHFLGDVESDRHTRSLLADGVTTVRDMYADSAFVPLQAARIAAGNQLGPDILGAGIIDGWYPDTLLFGRFPNRIEVPVQARDSSDVRRLVERYQQLGYAWIKIYDGLPPHLVRYAIAEAHRREMRVTGHVPVEMSGLAAVEAGFDQITHAPELVAYLVNRDLRDPIAGGVNGERAAALDLGSRETLALVDAMKARDVSLEPTLCVYQPRLTAGNDAARRAYDKLVGFVRLLRERDVRIAVGTDNNCSVVKELELLRDAGFTNAQLLRAATFDAARSVQRDRETGSIEPGKTADLLILGGNPLDDIGALRDIRMVIKNGIVFNAGTLERWND